jgi:hypothetical protein
MSSDNGINFGVRTNVIASTDKLSKLKSATVVNQFYNLTGSLKKLLDLHLQSYILLFIMIVNVMIAILNKKVDKKIPVILIINAVISMYIIECLIMGGCEFVTWLYLVLNTIMMLGLNGFLTPDVSFKFNTLIIDSQEKEKENNNIN